MTPSLRLAFGWQGLELPVPDGVELCVPRPVAGEQPPADAHALLRRALDQPVAGPPLKELAAGRRRAAIIVGDALLPAPYAEVLPELARCLIECGIRPSRVVFLSRPGASGPALGLAAIRRYGEETVGQYELHAWTPTLERAGHWDEAYTEADVRLAVLPGMDDARVALPAQAPPALVVGLSLGRGLVGRIEGISAGPPEVIFPRASETQDRAAHCALPPFVKGGQGGCRSVPPPLDKGGPGGCRSVQLVTGGGAPTDATLEDSLLGLRRLSGAGGTDAVLAFLGEEGLGSARFVIHLQSLLLQAEDELSQVGSLPASEPLSPLEWDAPGALAEALCAFGRVLLFSPGLAQHEEGEELRDRLAALPNLAGRIRLMAEPSELWAALAAIHGPQYRLCAEPLGWRGKAEG